MSDWELFIRMMCYGVGATLLLILGCIIADTWAAISDRRRRRKYRNNYVRFE